MSDEIKISEYVKKRNELLIIFEDLSDKELLDKLSDINLNNMPPSPKVARIALHKMRLQVPIMPKNLVEKSKKWLLDNGYSLKID